MIRWQPPWPMIKISEVEWIILRDDPTYPVAVVRELPERTPDRYRIVRWAPRSEDRRLFGYAPSLEAADLAVTFTGPEPDMGITRLSTERPEDWGRFERWFWTQASDQLVLECGPGWVQLERMYRARAAVERQ